ncbi:MAG: peptide chain release factor N(5)-glutamine methyltransferase [Acidobacteriota bacterium]|nr:peptide chain release factor N(5)-glutamine methyltransferase [Acidobacteriota bacterium]
MTPALAALVRQAADQLRGRRAEGQNAALDAEVLARHVLGWDRARWIADSRSAADPAFIAAFNSLIARRMQGEPVAYLTGHKEFWGLEFEVTPDVLIPRPETELLVERALEAVDRLAAGGKAVAVADVGTGSGCIAIALAHERPSLHVIATDISPGALAIARRNATRHGVDGRIDFRLTHVLDGAGAVDVVVSNPPYIADGDPAVMADVRDHEPPAALFSGGDGLHVIRALLAGAAGRSPAPLVLFEFGGNESAVRAAVAAAGLRVTAIVSDLAGIPRVAVVEG